MPQSFGVANCKDPQSLRWSLSAECLLVIRVGNSSEHCSEQLFRQRLPARDSTGRTRQAYMPLFYVYLEYSSCSKLLQTPLQQWSDSIQPKNRQLYNWPFARKARGMHTYVTSHPEYTALPLVLWIIYWNSPAARCLAALALGSYRIYLQKELDGKLESQRSRKRCDRRFSRGVELSYARRYVPCVQ